MMIIIVAMMSRMIMINRTQTMCVEFDFFCKTCKIKITLLQISITRYDFEANKKNNLIFYGLPSDQRETPNSLVTKVKLISERSTTPNE